MNPSLSPQKPSRRDALSATAVIVIWNQKNVPAHVRTVDRWRLIVDGQSNDAKSLSDRQRSTVNHHH